MWSEAELAVLTVSLQMVLTAVVLRPRRGGSLNDVDDDGN